MDPTKFSWNEFAKDEQRLTKFYSKRDFLIARVSDAFFYLGAIVSIIQSFATPKTLNFTILGIYIFIYILRRFHILKPKSHGVIRDTKTGIPIPFAIVKIFSKATNIQIIQKATNKIGKYLILVPNGEYYAKIDRKNLDESYSAIKETESFTVRKGVVDLEWGV